MESNNHPDDDNDSRWFDAVEKERNTSSSIVEASPNNDNVERTGESLAYFTTTMTTRHPEAATESGGPTPIQESAGRNLVTPLSSSSTDKANSRRATPLSTSSVARALHPPTPSRPDSRTTTTGTAMAIKNPYKKHPSPDAADAAALTHPQQRQQPHQNKEAPNGRHFCEKEDSALQPTTAEEEQKDALLMASLLAEEANNWREPAASSPIAVAVVAPHAPKRVATLAAASTAAADANARQADGADPTSTSCVSTAEGMPKTRCRMPRACHSVATPLEDVEKSDRTKRPLHSQRQKQQCTNKLPAHPQQQQQFMYKNLCEDNNQAEEGITGRIVPFPFLGRLRVREGISFQWKDDTIVDTSKKLGRVYFSSFCLEGQSFRIGDTVRVSTEYTTPTVFVIASAFQATKSFLGGKEHLEEIQKRGHPYMELVASGAKDTEATPDWLLDPSLRIEQWSGGCDPPPTRVQPRMKWSIHSNAKRVNFYTRRPSKLAKTSRIEIMLHVDSSDESDPSREYADEDLDSEASDKPVKRDRRNRSKSACTDLDSSKPAVQLVVHDDTDLDKFFHERESRDGLSLHPMIDCIETVAMSFSDGGRTAEELRRNWQMQRKLQIHSDDNPLIDIVNDDDTQVDSELDRIRSKYYDSPFRPLQYRVLYEIVKGRLPKVTRMARTEVRDDVFFIAPCGYGKSLCFVIASQALGKVTLVIEPLRALISSQVSQLIGKGVKVEALLTVEDAQRERKSPAAIRLNEIARDNCRDPLILFATPEMMTTKSCLDGFRSLVYRDQISLVVIDEFDFIEESSALYRTSYLKIVPELREVIQGHSIVPFLFLSATGSADLIEKVFVGKYLRENKRRPLLCVTKNVLPKMHVYSVERKISDEQAVNRIIFMMSNYDATLSAKQDASRSICYCLTPKRCELVADLLHTKGIHADVFHSGQTSIEHKHIIDQFLRCKIRVICATKSFGRGVNLDCPVRFVFHIVIPTSISDYVQETGRGGRDGGICYCILFYRPQDRSLATNVTQRERPLAIDNVCKYAMDGGKCRTSMLAHYAVVISRMTRKIQQCMDLGLCDNCRIRSDLNLYGKVDVSDKVRELVSSAVDFEFVKSLRKAGYFLAPKMCAVESVFLNPEVIDCLQRHISAANQHEESASEKSLLAKWCNSLDTMKISFHLQFTGLTVNQPPRKTIEEPPVSIFDVETCVSAVDHLTPSRPRNHPFLLEFEAQRLGVKLTEINLPSSIHAACEILFRKAGMKIPPYLRALEDSTAKGLSVSLFYRARLQVNGSLALDEPELALDRRIYRMFGADRFLEVSVSLSVKTPVAIKFFSYQAQIANRSYRFLWGKKAKNPQPFVMFAEKGCGISQKDECTIEDVYNRCIPPTHNPTLTLGQIAKRMKINFSGTTAACKLPPGSVSILKEVKSDAIDGAGLISRESLDAVWSKYQSNLAKRKYQSNREREQLDGSPCPYSGFQGRLAGFKGIWILDQRLDGFVVECRSSQMKYAAPMRCLDAPLDEVDEVYETIEVSSFCVALHTRLNTRFIQILEHHANEMKRTHEFLTFLSECLEETVEEIKGLLEEDNAALVDKLRFRLAKQNSDDTGHKDSDMLLKMALANVGTDDPEFCRRRSRLINKMMAAVREKAHYNIRDCCDLRIYPDHTCLLRSNEAFLPFSLADRLQISGAKEVLAMRSPSYFPNDLRRLSLVSYETLLQRARGDEARFFQGIKNAIVLSTSEAQNMSGGDYDGDRAWVCTNEELLNCIPNEIESNDYSNLCARPSPLENKLWSESTMDDLLKYMMNFRRHQNLLGSFSEMLDVSIDKYGFGHPLSRELGNASFLQVDMPFHPYEMQTKTPSFATTPDWKQKQQTSKNCYLSERALGQLYRQMTVKMECSSHLTPQNESADAIRQYLNRCRDRPLLEGMEFRAQTAIKNYMFKWREAWELASKNNFLEKRDEQFRTWQAQYCSQQRTELVERLAMDPAQDQSSLMAAVIYCQCRRYELSEKSSRACEFAWSVCEKELLYIYSDDRGGKAPLTIANDCLSMLLPGRRQG